MLLRFSIFVRALPPSPIILPFIRSNWSGDFPANSCRFITCNALGSSNNYERLEFLGDALLNIIVTKWLYDRYPYYDEGKLTKKRAELVNKNFLLTISKRILTVDDILIGNSIQKNNKKTQQNTQKESAKTNTKNMKNTKQQQQIQQNSKKKDKLQKTTNTINKKK